MHLLIESKSVRSNWDTVNVDQRLDREPVNGTVGIFKDRTSRQLIAAFAPAETNYVSELSTAHQQPSDTIVFSYYVYRFNQSISHKNQLTHCVTSGLQKKKNAKKLLKQRKL